MILRLALLLLFSTELLAMGPGRYQLLTDKNTANNQPAESPRGYVFDITVQNVEQLDAILNRADRLRGQFSPDQHGRIALVLHGQELQLFRKRNYQQYMSIVEKARSLDQQNLVDIKACQSVMENLRIEQSELPDFIEQVPLAPVEIDRLQRQKGYTRL